MTPISIIICTRDRAESLRETLRSLAEVEVPPGLSAELLVIDNGSSDHTPVVVHDATLPRLQVRYAYEPAGGQAVARNAGLALASGEIILFTDDDIRFPSSWIEHMCRPILDGRADAVAGEIRLAPHLHRQWMQNMHRSWLACSDPTPSQPRLIGASMAFSRRVLDVVPQFDPELGPGARGFADDHLFGEQLRTAGFIIQWQAAAPVEHHCDPSRLRRASFVRAAARQGNSVAYFEHHWQREPARWPRLHALRLTLELWVWRALHPLTLRQTEGIAPEELYRLYRAEYYRQRAAQRAVPPRYDKSRRPIKAGA